MISYLRGSIINKTASYIIIDVNGVGYRVEVGGDLLQMEQGHSIELFIHTNVSQDNIRLIGFDSFEKLHLFEMLISISGIGPKAGLSIMSALSSEEIMQGLKAKDVQVFTKVSGIGKKNAQRIILELSNNLPDLSIEPSSGVSDELSQALKSLGYQNADIEYVKTKVKTDGEISAQLKEALRLLSR